MTNLEHLFFVPHIPFTFTVPVTFVLCIYLIFHDRAQRLPQLNGLQLAVGGPMIRLIWACARRRVAPKWKFALVCQGKIKRILNREGFIGWALTRRSLRRSGMELCGCLMTGSKVMRNDNILKLNSGSVTSCTAVSVDGKFDRIWDAIWLYLGDAKWRLNFWFLADFCDKSSGLHRL